MNDFRFNYSVIKIKYKGAWNSVFLSISRIIFQNQYNRISEEKIKFENEVNLAEGYREKYFGKNK